MTKDSNNDENKNDTIVVNDNQNDSSINDDGNDDSNSNSSSNSNSNSNSSSSNNELNDSGDDNVQIDTFVDNEQMAPTPSSLPSSSLATTASSKNQQDEFQDNPTGATGKQSKGIGKAKGGNSGTSSGSSSSSSSSSSNKTKAMIASVPPPPPPPLPTSSSSSPSSASLLDAAIQEEEEEQQQQQQQQQSSSKHLNNSTNHKTEHTETMDAETKVATQMAAMAAVVTAATREHKIIDSPSIAATYVKDLMSASNNGVTPPPPPPPKGPIAVIPSMSSSSSSSSSVPPPPPPPPLPKGTTVVGMKKKKKKTRIVPVHLNLVQKYLEIEMDSFFQQYDDDDDHDNDNLENENKTVDKNVNREKENTMNETNTHNEQVNVVVENEQNDIITTSTTVSNDSHESMEKEDHTNGTNDTNNPTDNNDQRNTLDEKNQNKHDNNNEHEKDEQIIKQSSDTNTDTDTNMNMNTNTNTNTKRNTNTPSTTIPPVMILLQQMLQNGNGGSGGAVVDHHNEHINYFLKQLLILTHHTCIDATSSSSSSAASPKSQQQQQQQQQHQHQLNQQSSKNSNHEEKKEKSNDDHGHNNNNNNTNKSAAPPVPVPISVPLASSIINEDRAKRAALKVMDLLEQIDSSFQFLHCLLPSTVSTSTATTITRQQDCDNVGLKDYDHRHGESDDNNDHDHDNKQQKKKVVAEEEGEELVIIDHDNAIVNSNVEFTIVTKPSASNEGEGEELGENENEGEGEDGYIPSLSSTSGTNKIIPDLLPRCMSENGDATNIFFKACQPLQSLSSSLLNEHNNNGGGNSNNPNDNNNNNDSSTISKARSSSLVASAAATASALTTSGRSSPRNVASSMFSSVFSSVKTGTMGKRRTRNKAAAKVTATEDNDTNSTVTSASTATTASHHTTTTSGSTSGLNGTNNGTSSSSTQVGLDYNVVIEREMLGLTVENVLERTVVRTVLPEGAAKKAGTKVGSLIVKVGSVETKNLTHFETIDELRRSKRPLRLILRRISNTALKGAREEMGRLIKGGGFGNSIVDAGNGNIRGNNSNDTDNTKQSNQNQNGNDNTSYSLNKDLFSNCLEERWLEGSKLNSSSNIFSKKEETLSKAGAKLVWLLTLLIVGMEREAESIKSYEKEKDGFNDGRRNATSENFYSAEDYIDAGKSISKVLHDYVQNHFARGTKTSNSDTANSMNKKRMKQAPPAHIQDRQRNAIPGASRRNPQQSAAHASSNSSTGTALSKIGDVLHRTRSFFADPNSPPAALLRGEVIALLCDVLDLDTDMALSEEEASSSTTGRSNGPINDIGSAGSLMKLIVLNCSVMRSVGCVDTDESCHALHAGNRFLAVVHRLAASRSISARVTACSLGPVLWGHLDFPHQLQLRGVITRALHDVNVIVRKSTATVLHEIAELVFDSRAVPWLVLMCERAMTDPEAQLRAAAMTLTWHLAEHLPNAFFGDARQGSRSRRRLPSRTDPAFFEVYLLQCKLLPVATQLADDEKSASVRLAVAAQCDRLANALGAHWFSVIIDSLQGLLGDTDDTVRAEATLCIPRLAEIVLVESDGSNSTVLESLLPVVFKLLKDPDIDVRVAIATAAGELLTLLVGFQRSDEVNVVEGSSVSEEKERPSYKKYIDETLIPLLQSLLQDPNPEVTSSALRAITNTSKGHVKGRRSGRNEDDSVSLSSSHQSHLIEKKDPVFIPVLSEEQVLRLVPTLSKLATSGQWRVRQSAVEIVPALLGCTHKIETRTEIAQLCVTLMDDGVDAVRRTAAECLCLGANSGGEGTLNSQEWVKTVVMSHVEACRDSSKSKQRLLSLKMVEIILTNGLCHSESKTIGNVVISPNNTSISLQGALVRQNLEILSSLSDDAIANVRLNVGRVLCNVIGTLEEDDIQFVINVLNDQTRKEKARSTNGDRDVYFFAKKAKKLAKERLNIFI